MTPGECEDTESNGYGSCGVEDNSLHVAFCDVWCSGTVRAKSDKVG